MPCIDSASGLESGLQDLKGGIDFDFFDDNVSSDFEYEKIMSKSDEKTNIKITVKAIVEEIRSNTGRNTTDKPTGDKQFMKNVSVEEKPYKDKYSEYAEIMKCIAYEDQQNEITHDQKVESSLDVSLSDSTPSSDLTSVTPLSCSSGSLNREFKVKQNSDNSMIDDECSETNSYEHKMTFLTKALDDLDLCSRSNSRNMSSCIQDVSNQYSRRKNMTFTNEQMRQIDRENDRLLKRIMSYSKPRSKPLCTVNDYQSKKTSAAINRTKQQKQIEHDNFILWKKIRNVRQKKMN